MFCLIYGCVPGAHRGQKRASDTLELELQMVESHHVGVKNRSRQKQQVLLTTEPAGVWWHTP